MAHKKYIKRNGKVFGPYYYENYRVGSKVKTRYIGTKPPSHGSRLTSLKGNRIVLPAAVLAAVLVFAIAGTTFTGMLADERRVLLSENVSFSVAGGGSAAWEPQVQGELRSFRISGRAEGNGSVRIYLKEKDGDARYLVLDTELQNGSVLPIPTGFAIGEENGSVETTEVQPENGSENVPGYGPGLPAEETANGSVGDGAAPEGAENTTYVNESLPEIPGNVTMSDESGMPAEESVNETPAGEAGSMPAYVENETIPTEAAVEITFFADACEETCMMSGSADSYDIIVEAGEGTVVKIDMISYVVLEAAEAPAPEQAAEPNISAAAVNETGVPDEAYGLRRMIGKGKFSGRVELKNVSRDGGKSNVDIAFSDERGGGRGLIRLYGVGNVSDIAAIQTGEYGKAVEKMVLTTDAVAVNVTGMERAEITMPKRGQVGMILRCQEWDYENFMCAGDWEDAGLPFTDNGTHVTFEVSGFSGYAGAQITVISLQSYPDVGGEWAVEFATEGIADLTITAAGGTSFGIEGGDGDLEFLSLSCGGEDVPYEWVNGSVFAANYSCNATGGEKSKVLTTGKHVLEFSFGGDVAYARNLAGYGGYKVQSGYSVMPIGSHTVYVPLPEPVADVTRA
ncbi:MAG: hypothetical protein V1813_00585, partial [Candidatus Aenigmatarchaeota archaeon]